MRNLEIIIFENGVSIGGTEKTKEIDEDYRNDSLFSKEYGNYSDSEKLEMVIEVLREQINDELNRIGKE